MFTGLVEETGKIESIEPSAKAIRLTVQSTVCASDAKIGDSIAVNGCCLTVAAKGGKKGARWLQFYLLQETWNLTSLSGKQPGQSVNLERSLRADGRFGGHYVTGHIDGTGEITRWEKSGPDWVLEIKAPAAIMRYVLHKGSIAVDGISLTVAEVRKSSFRIWIIPHTCEVTALRERRQGDAVNLEADLFAKYVEKFSRRATGS